MSRKITEEKIVQRIEGESSRIQGRIQNLQNRTSQLPTLLRKVLVLREEYSRSRKAIKRQFKILDQELSSYIDFLEERVPSRDKDFQKKKENLTIQLRELKSSIRESEKIFSKSLEDLPPDIVP